MKTLIVHSERLDPLAAFSCIAAACNLSHVCASLATSSFELARNYALSLLLPVEINGWYEIEGPKLANHLTTLSVTALSVSHPKGMILYESIYNVPFQNWDGKCGKLFQIQIPLSIFGTVSSEIEAEALTGKFLGQLRANAKNIRISSAYDQGNIQYFGLVDFTSEIDAKNLLVILLAAIPEPVIRGAISVTQSARELEPVHEFQFIKLNSFPTDVFNLNRYRSVYSIDSASSKILKPQICIELAMNAQRRLLLDRSETNFFSMIGADYIKWPILSNKIFAPSRGNCLKHTIENTRQKVEISVSSYEADEPSESSKILELRNFIKNIT